MFCEKCGKRKKEGDKFCADCGASFGTVEQVTIQPESVPRNVNAEYNSIGGWLYVVGFGLFVTPFILGYGVIESFSLVSDGSLVELDSIAPGFTNAIWFELIMDSTFFLFVIYLLFLFKDRKSMFPKYFIWYLAGSVAYLFVDYAVFASISTSNSEIADILDSVLQEQIGSMVSVIIGSIVWAAYMLKSKRVKGTFIN